MVDHFLHWTEELLLHVPVQHQLKLQQQNKTIGFFFIDKNSFCLYLAEVESIAQQEYH